MIPYRQDPEHIAPANQAPRCQHIRATGRSCGSPALRGETLCYFHNRASSTKGFSTIAFIEDATSLQCALMKVIDLLRGGHACYKECALLLYALRIASFNLKGFAAERAEREGVACETPKPPAAQKKESDPGLAGMLLRLLATDADDPDTKPPVIRTPQDRKRVAAVLPEQAPSEQNVKRSRVT
ncbi:MAG: hypothetical protein WA188_21585 [Terriglobales bacterium]